LLKIKTFTGTKILDTMLVRFGIHLSTPGRIAKIQDYPVE